MKTMYPNGSFAATTRPVEMQLLPIFTLLFHPSIHFLYPLNPSVGSRGGSSLSQRSLGERRGTLYCSPFIFHIHCMLFSVARGRSLSLAHTGKVCRSITGPNKKTCVLTLACMVRTWRESMQAQGKHADSKQKGPS